MEIFYEIKTRAKKFEDNNDKFGIYYLIGIDKDGYQVTEIDGHNSYCDDCVDEVVDKYQKILNENPLDLNIEKSVKKISMVEENSPERDDFCYCDNCGNLISNVGVLHTFSQEFDYWLHDDVSVNINELDDKDCFILNELIENAVSEWPDLINHLKRKIELENAQVV